MADIHSYPISQSQFNAIMDFLLKLQFRRNYSLHYSVLERNIRKTECYEQEMSESRKHLCHMAISISSCISAIATQRVHSLLNMLRKSSSEEYRTINGLLHNFGSDGKLKSMYYYMNQLLNEWSDKMEHMCKTVPQEDYDIRFADSLDYAESTIDPILQALSRHIDIYIKESGPSAPADAVALSELSMSIYLCDLSRHFFDAVSSSKNFPVLRKNREFNFLNLELIWQQLMKIVSHLNFYDHNGSISKFSIYTMLRSSTVESITDDIMCLFYSSEFIDEITKLQCGVDLELRKTDLKSLIESFEPRTISIRGFQNKYRKMFTEQYKNKKQ